MRKGQKYLYKGEFRNVTDIAAMAGVQYDRLCRRLRNGFSITSAIELSLKPNVTRSPRYHVVNGTGGPLKKIATQTGIPIGTLYSRLHAGEPITRAVDNSARDRKRRITFNDETLSIDRWAARLGLTRSGLWERLAMPRLWPIERALTTPNASKKGKAKGSGHASV